MSAPKVVFTGISFTIEKHNSGPSNNRVLQTYSVTADIYLFKSNSGKTQVIREDCSKLTIKIPERPQSSHSDIFIVNFEQILHNALLFPQLILNNYMPVGKFFRQINCICTGIR